MNRRCPPYISQRFSIVHHVCTLGPTLFADGLTQEPPGGMRCMFHHLAWQNYRPTLHTTEILLCSPLILCQITLKEKLLVLGRSHIAISQQTLCFDLVLAENADCLKRSCQQATGFEIQEDICTYFLCLPCPFAAVAFGKRFTIFLFIIHKAMYLHCLLRCLCLYFED